MRFQISVVCFLMCAVCCPMSAVRFLMPFHVPHQFITLSQAQHACQVRPLLFVYDVCAGCACDNSIISCTQPVINLQSSIVHSLFISFVISWLLSCPRKLRFHRAEVNILIPYQSISLPACSVIAVSIKWETSVRRQL